MTIKRERQAMERTPEEKARIDAIRKQFQAEKPGPDQLTTSGEYERVLAGVFWEVRRIAASIKAERERQGLTLAQLSERCGVDKGAISKLETGKQVNPTVDTLSRIAGGLGMRLGMSLAREGEPDKEVAALQTHNASAAEVICNHVFWHALLMELQESMDDEFRQLLTGGKRGQGGKVVLDDDFLARFFTSRRQRAIEQLRHFEEQELARERRIMAALKGMKKPLVITIRHDETQGKRTNTSN